MSQTHTHEENGGVRRLRGGPSALNRSDMVLFRLHREMHRALSLLQRRTQQLRETGETGKNLGLKYRKEVREGGKYVKERVVSPMNKKNGEGKQKPEKTRK